MLVGNYLRLIAFFAFLRGKIEKRRLDHQNSQDFSPRKLEKCEKCEINYGKTCKRNDCWQLCLPFSFFSAPKRRGR